MGHKGPITSVALSDDGSLAVTGSVDKSVKVWMSVTGQLLWTLKDRFSTGAVTSVAMSKDNKVILVGYENGNVALWDITGITPLKINNFKLSDSAITSVDIN